MDRREFVKGSIAAAGVAGAAIGNGKVSSAGAAGSTTEEVRGHYGAQLLAVEGSEATLRTEHGVIKVLDDGRFGTGWSHAAGDVVSAVEIDGSLRLVPALEWSISDAGTPKSFIQNRRTGRRREFSTEGGRQRGSW